MASEYNLEINQGETFILNMTLKDTITGIALDLTGYIFRGQIRQFANSSTVIEEFTCTFVDAATGQVQISLTDEETSLIPAHGSTYKSKTKYVYDIEMEDPTGQVRRLLNGYVYVSPEVTK